MRCEYIACDITSTSGSWAGKSIASAGPKVRSLPLPFAGDPGGFDGRGLSVDEKAARSWRSCALTRFKAVGPASVGLPAWQDTLEILISEHAQGTSGTTLRVLRLFERSLEVMRNSKCIWYLRDWTSKELIKLYQRDGHFYVAGAFCTAHLSNQQYSGMLLSLDDLVAMQCRLGSDVADSNGDVDAVAWTQGPWAGHCFDIVSERQHELEYPSAQRYLKLRSSLLVSGADSAERWQDTTEHVLLVGALEMTRYKGMRSLHAGQHCRVDASRAQVARSEAWRSYMDKVQAAIDCRSDHSIDDDTDVDGAIASWEAKLRRLSRLSKPEHIMAEVHDAKLGRLI